MTLDWLYEGTNAGFMMAQEKGFYRDAGLEVAIAAGNGSSTTAQLVASKASQLGFADGFVVGNGISKGMNLRTLGSIFRRNPCVIIVFDDSPIKSPKDLEGKKVGISAGSAVFQQWPAFCKGAGVDATKVEINNVGPAGLAPALINGQVDALGVFVARRRCGRWRRVGAGLVGRGGGERSSSTSASFATSASPLTARAPSFAPNRNREKEFREKGIRRVDVGQQPRRRLDRVSRSGAPAGRSAGTALLAPLDGASRARA
ncbi:MAG: ABC transporter substrate-binding protein [Xanthobacteraceae bacterium]